MNVLPLGYYVLFKSLLVTNLRHPDWSTISVMGTRQQSIMYDRLFTYNPSSFLSMNARTSTLGLLLILQIVDSRMRNSMPFTHRDTPLHSYAYS